MAGDSRDRGVIVPAGPTPPLGCTGEGSCHQLPPLLTTNLRRRWVTTSFAPRLGRNPIWTFWSCSLSRLGCQREAGLGILGCAHASRVPQHVGQPRASILREAESWESSWKHQRHSQQRWPFYFGNSGLWHALCSSAQSPRTS